MDSKRLQMAFMSSELLEIQRNKTQVVPPASGLNQDWSDDRFETRLTHSLKVGSCCEVVVKNILTRQGVDVDPTDEAMFAGMAHDLGHPGGGHDAADCLHAKLIAKGLLEGFDDNASVITVLERHNLISAMSPRSLASIIKYPHKLYPEHKSRYEKTFQSVVKSDSELVSAKLDRSIVCDIMDRVDEIVYTCSDIADAMVLGFISKSELESITSGYGDIKGSEIVALVKAAAIEESKTTKRALMSKVQAIFIDDLMLSNTGRIVFMHQQLEKIRNDLFKIEHKYFIKAPKVLERRDEFIKHFSRYVDRVLDEDFIPSNRYKALIASAKSSDEVLRLKRDMIQEASEAYIYVEGAK